ncbi:MAG: trypsin-like peptidase domain-containing protein [Planctomycetes bacterium]|nr:trypsin-like peptidase domain-containing protein [Planctomycetota bacterium]
MRRIVAYGPAMIVLLTAVAALFAVPAIVQRINIAQTTAQIRLARLQIEDDDILERINRAVRSVAQAVEPSVVHIEALRPSRGQRRVSSGAGWVFDDQGHIVTNAHVVGDSLKIDVQFSDGREVSAVIVGTDEYTDIAVLRASTRSGMFPITRATREPPKIGDRVFAFGSPFGFKFSMSEGIVSGLGRNPRSAVEISGFANFIQTDAAVNPGNSGGPLVDVSGRLIGMNVAIATGSQTDGSIDGSGQSAGISFAIPLATIESVATQIIESGKVARGYFGIRYNGSWIVDVSDARTRRSGVAVTSVQEDGPAWRGGMRTNDVIVEINGQRITDTDMLRSSIAPLRPGQRMRVRVWRSDNPDIAEVLDKLHKRYLSRREAISSNRPAPLPGRYEMLTIRLGEFPPVRLANEVLRPYGIQLVDTEYGPRVNGLRINGRQIVSRRSSAYRDGLRHGQLIVSVQGHDVENTQDVLRYLTGAGFLETKSVLVVVQDADGDQRELSIRLSRERP